MLLPVFVNPPKGVISLKSEGADNFLIDDDEEGTLAFEIGWTFLSGCRMLSAELFKTPIFLLFPPPKPLLNRANLEGTVVIVLCLVSFLFRDEVSLETSFKHGVVRGLEVVALLLDFEGLEELGGRDPDLLDPECH